MSTNLSKNRREKMIESLKEMRKLINNNPEMMSRISEIENELNKKKYGLVWEAHEENVDNQIKTKIPVFIEDKSLEIKTEDSKPINFLIEGDNLHSLYLLEKTHKEKIDVIYIDPPYNTGNKDFIYDDDCLEKEDGFKHSKWLSFMDKRLNIAKKLLSKKGIILISIDDNEQSQLKLLCDEIYGEKNNIGTIIIKSTPNARDYGHIGKMHEYVLVYAKNIEFTKTNRLHDYKKKFKYNDDNGGYNIHPLYNSNEAFSKNNRPNLYYSFYLNKDLKNKDGFYEIGLENKEGWIEIYPPKSVKNSVQFVWRWGREKALENLNKEIMGHKVGNDYRIVQKMRNEEKIIRSILDDSGYTTRKGTAEIEEIFGEKKFSFPKPLELIKTLIQVASHKNSIVLDFFAGSGTTGQAVLELNEVDNKERSFILCTNDENNICKEITYQRILKVINGYSNHKHIKANLKYYKTEYIDRFNSYDTDYYITQELSKYIKELVQLENGIDESDPRIKIIFEDEELDKFLINNDKMKECKILYLDRNAMIDGQHEVEFKKNNIQICYIPEYYFENEIMEAEEW